MDSQAAAPGPDWELGKGERPGELGCDTCCGMEEQGHAPPSETPSMAVRDGGQIGPSPVISTFQNTGRTTIGVEEACVVGCATR